MWWRRKKADAAAVVAKALAPAGDDAVDLRLLRVWVFPAKNIHSPPVACDQHSPSLNLSVRKNEKSVCTFIKTHHGKITAAKIPSYYCKIILNESGISVKQWKRFSKPVIWFNNKSGD